MHVVAATDANYFPPFFCSLPIRYGDEAAETERYEIELPALSCGIRTFRSNCQLKNPRELSNRREKNSFLELIKPSDSIKFIGLENSYSYLAVSNVVDEIKFLVR